MTRMNLPKPNIGYDPKAQPQKDAKIIMVRKSTPEPISPVQDHKLIHALEKIHIKYCSGDDFQMLSEMLKEVAKYGYHKDG